jgi:hypothetical protein
MREQRGSICFGEGPFWQKDFIEKPFQARGHHFPPHRENVDQMVGLLDARLVGADFGIESFPLVVDGQFFHAHDRVEDFLVEIQQIDLVACRFQPADHRAQDRIVEAGGPGVVNRHHHAHQSVPSQA